MDISFSLIAGNLGIMFFLILLGYLARPKKESLDDISRLVIDFALPALIFHSIIAGFSAELFSSMLVVFAFSIGTVSLGYAVCWLVIKVVGIPRKNWPEFYLGGPYGNSGFIGIPLALAVFGSQGALFATVFDVGAAVMIFSVGMLLLTGSGKNNLLKNIINPPIVALFAGIIIVLLKIPVPAIALSGVNVLGSMTTPLAMMFVGGILANIKGKILWRDKTMISLILTKLILLPLTVLFFIRAFGLTGILAGVILLQAATPIMVASPLLYQRYRGDAGFLATAVFLSTLFSILTISLLMILL